MKKTKEQRGITLVALIITVIVLLTLAVVTISVVRGDGIIGNARNAVNKYRGKYYEYWDSQQGKYVGEWRDGAVQAEASILDYYSQYLDSNGEVLTCNLVERRSN